MLDLTDLLDLGWIITFEPSGNSRLPYLCTCVRTIDYLAPHIFRRCLGTAAGQTPDIALDRALALAEANELQTITIHTRSEPAPLPKPNLLQSLGLDKPTSPAAPIRRF